MYSILTLLTGLCISSMIFFNGSLNGYVGNFAALIFIHLSGFIVICFMNLKRSKPQVRSKRSKWYLLAGVMGLVVVSLNNIIFKMGGVLLTLGGTLAGQVIMALFMELIKNRQSKERLPAGKIISLTLVVPGATVIGLRSGLPFYWILISWIPGALVMLQSFMNSQNIIAYGFKKTLLIHYGSPLLLLLLAIPLFPEIMESFNMVISGEIPIQYLSGGGIIAILVVSLGSYLLLKLKPITYVLLIYTGQLSSAIVIDYTQGLPLSREKAVAMLLIVTGLILGEKRFKRH